MRWDFILFFASLVMIYIGDWALYVGVSGLILSGLHGIQKSVKQQRIRQMIVMIGLTVSGAAFLGLGAFALKPGWFGLAPTLSPQPSKPGPLAGLTNAQLRERTLAFVQTLRNFEGEHEAEESRLQNEEFSALRQPQNATPPKRPYSDGLIERYNAYTKEFMQTYRSDAVIIREEIQTRLGGALPKFPATSMPGKSTEALGTQIFEGPLLAGPHPISAGADLLEYWARQLP